MTFVLLIVNNMMPAGDNNVHKLHFMFYSFDSLYLMEIEIVKQKAFFLRYSANFSII